MPMMLSVPTMDQCWERPLLPIVSGTPTGRIILTASPVAILISEQATRSSPSKEAFRYGRALMVFLMRVPVIISNPVILTKNQPGNNCYEGYSIGFTMVNGPRFDGVITQPFCNQSYAYYTGAIAYRSEERRV